MKESKADLILHPVRIRIIQSFFGGRHLTRQQLNELLPDIPQATMYRHLNKLTKAGIITVVDQNPVRGTVERVYALPEHATEMTQEEILHASREDHMGYFIKFLATLMGDFGRYLEQDEIDLIADGVTYRQIPLYLSNEEMLEMFMQVGEVFQKYMSHEPGAKRRRRMITTIVIPEQKNKKS